MSAAADVTVDRFEQTPLAEIGLHMNLHEVVDLGTDPPNDAAAALGQEEGGASVAEPRILLGIEQGVDFALERRDPGRVVAIDFPCKIDERLAVPGRGNGADVEVTHRPQGLANRPWLVTSGSPAVL